MHRLILIFGLLLLPTSALAQNVPPPALSPWVQRVIDRTVGSASPAQQFVNALMTGSCTPENSRNRDTDIVEALSAIRQVVDTRTQITLQYSDLSTRTVCQTNDIRLLENAMSSLRAQMVSAAQSCSFGALRVLASMYTFVAQAQQSVIEGGTDPTATDPRLRSDYFWENDSLYRQGITERENPASQEPLCPFTTDYLPRAVARSPEASPPETPYSQMKSYGCDATVLPQLDPSMQAEASPLSTFLITTDDFARAIAGSMFSFVNDLDIAIARIRGEQPPDNTPLQPLSSPTPHGKASGCMVLPRPPAADMQDYLRDEPDYLSRNYSTPSALQSGYALEPIGLMFLATFTPFGDNVIGTIAAYAARMAQIGYQRPLPSTVGLEEFGVFWSPFFTPSDGSPELAYRAFTANQEEAKALMEAWNHDGAQRMNAALEPLVSGMETLGTAVTKTFPNYVRDLAYFLRRSCVSGHCSQKLDAVLKRVTNPSCFPYASGEYVRDPDYVKKCYCQDQYASAEYCAAQP